MSLTWIIILSVVVLTVLVITIIKRSKALDGKRLVLARLNHYEVGAFEVMELLGVDDSLKQAAKELVAKSIADRKKRVTDVGFFSFGNNPKAGLIDTGITEEIVEEVNDIRLKAELEPISVEAPSEPMPKVVVPPQGLPPSSTGTTP